jgi:P pilus assembly chaperone PapD
MRHSSRILASLWALAIGATGTMPAHAQGLGDLTVTPTRVVFDGRTRSAQLSVINRGTKKATYRIAFHQLRMSEDGQMEEITTPGAGEKFADELLRFSPREVTLEPELAQTVRLQIRKPAGLPPGEYRSHLLLYAVPNEEEATPGTVALKDKEIGIRLTPIYRVSIPVIVREGELPATAALEDLAIQQKGAAPSLSFRLRRGGERSLYGDVTVTYVAADGRSTRVVGEIKGLAVYTPNEGRRVQMPLYPPPGLELKGGTLKVRFAEPRETREAVQTEASVPLP